MAVTRRQFVSQGGLLAASALAVPTVVGAATTGRFRSGQKPRHIIHLVSDGMSLGTLTCADHFSVLSRHRPLAWTGLYRRDGAVAALVNMRSLNSLVTDSAAASTSWGSGSRVKNGALNILPDGRELRPICTLFGEAGWARGLVTTTEITHATPAGFAANVLDRGTAPTIAVQYLERKIEVLLGGGQQYFDAARRKDKRDLKADYRRQGYAVFESRAALETAPRNKRWLGVFASGHLPFTIDHLADPALRTTVPTLPEMTRAALQRLERSGRFLLQVEGGRVDHGAHASDAAAALHDQIAFDEALEVCLEFQRRQPATLILVTTDHGNSNLGLNGMGTDYGKSPQLFANLRNVKMSFAELEKRLKKAAGADGVTERKLADGKTTRQIIRVSTEDLVRLVGEATGYELPAAKAEQFARYLGGELDPLYDQMNSPASQLGQVLANYLGIGWTGNAHTADYVPLVALGPGAERFRGFLQNTDIFPHYLALAGIKFRNPEVPLLAEGAPSAAEAEQWRLV
jgi:alkaline phosphatase